MLFIMLILNLETQNKTHVIDIIVFTIIEQLLVVEM